MACVCRLGDTSGERGQPSDGFFVPPDNRASYCVLADIFPMRHNLASILANPMQDREQRAGWGVIVD